MTAPKSKAKRRKAAWKLYEETMAPAWKLYEKTKAAALNIYEETIDQIEAEP